MQPYGNSGHREWQIKDPISTVCICDADKGQIAGVRRPFRAGQPSLVPAAGDGAGAAAVSSLDEVVVMACDEHRGVKFAGGGKVDENVGPKKLYRRMARTQNPEILRRLHDRLPPAKKAYLRGVGDQYVLPEPDLYQFSTDLWKDTGLSLNGVYEEGSVEALWSAIGPARHLSAGAALRATIDWMRGNFLTNFTRATRFSGSLLPKQKLMMEQFEADFLVMPMSSWTAEVVAGTNSTQHVIKVPRAGREAGTTYVDTRSGTCSYHNGSGTSWFLSGNLCRCAAFAISRAGLDYKDFMPIPRRVETWKLQWSRFGVDGAEAAGWFKMANVNFLQVNSKLLWPSYTRKARGSGKRGRSWNEKGPARKRRRIRAVK